MPKARRAFVRGPPGGTLADLRLRNPAVRGDFPVELRGFEPLGGPDADSASHR
jgi:hypothetical protein